MPMPAVLLATWRHGLFAFADNAIHEEWPGQSVRGLARDGGGDALAIVGGKTLCRRTREGIWSTVATSEIELSCCVAVGTTVYVGAESAAEVLREPRRWRDVDDRARWPPRLLLLRSRIRGR